MSQLGPRSRISPDRVEKRRREYFEGDALSNVERNATWAQHHGFKIERAVLYVVQSYAHGPLDDRVDQYWRIYGTELDGERPRSSGWLHHFGVESWRPTDEAVTLFACFCPPCTPAALLPDRYGPARGRMPSRLSEPVAIYSRSGDAWTVDICGVPVRPGVDGEEPNRVIRRRAWSMPDFSAEGIEDEVVRRWSPEETESRRKDYLAGPLLRDAIDLFGRVPDVPSALLVVAQFWDDTANDEVHAYWIFEPGAEASFDSSWKWFDDVSDYVEDGTPYRAERVASWNGLGDQLSLFSAYCDEFGRQQREDFQDYTAIAEYRRAGDGASFRFFGEQVRPWVDGADSLPWQTYTDPQTTDEMQVEVIVGSEQ